MSNLGPAPELDKLYKACREIEDTDGGWNAGDVVDIVTGLLAAHGYDLTPIVWCERCEETPAAEGAKLCADCAQEVKDEEADDGAKPDVECPECGAPAGKPCRVWCIVDQNQPAAEEAGR